MKKDVVSLSPNPLTVEIKKMDFPDAIRQIILGKSLTRLEWSNPEYFIKLADGHLKIHKPDGKFYDLIISDGDMMGDDWMLV